MEQTPESWLYFVATADVFMDKNETLNNVDVWAYKRDASRRNDLRLKNICTHIWI